MAQLSTNELKTGLKVEIEGEPYTIVTNEFVKPGKGQPFNRVKLKHLITGRVIERTLKSGEKIEIAEIQTGVFATRRGVEVMGHRSRLS